MTIEKSNKLIGKLLIEVIELQSFSGDLHQHEYREILKDTNETIDCDCTEEFKEAKLELIYNKLMGIVENKKTEKFVSGVINKKLSLE
jgi:hypothetical protein